MGLCFQLQKINPPFKPSYLIYPTVFQSTPARAHITSPESSRNNYQPQPSNTRGGAENMQSNLSHVHTRDRLMSHTQPKSSEPSLNRHDRPISHTESPASNAATNVEISVYNDQFQANNAPDD